MGKEGQTVLPANGTTRVSVLHGDERRGKSPGPEGVVDHKLINFPHLGALGPELAVMQPVFPDYARSFGIFGLDTSQVASQFRTGGEPKSA
jgi:hypothetical protein